MGQTQTQKETFHYVFQISNTITFEVNYYLLGSNENKYYSTCVNQFNRGKSDFDMCGQCQNELLKKNPLALNFYRRYDKFHTEDITETTYKAKLSDLEKLKAAYNFIHTSKDSGFSFSDLKELSKQKVK